MIAHEFGLKSIWVHAVSPGPLKTRLAFGLASSDELLAEAQESAPEHDAIDILDAAAIALSVLTLRQADYRCDDLNSRRVQYCWMSWNRLLLT
jgi:enoyl-[acyl-carrier-protein] reductase (NADH)